ncbi:MAG: cardiolipin synthase B [Gemmatimonadetes bacterium]|nr:cardiolipin synthase B [Gemmatimonadota bacterium]
MSELLSGDLPWWAWLLLAMGFTAIVAVVAALFLPDWHTPEDLSTTCDAEAGSEAFLGALSRFLNVPLVRGGTAHILQNGDVFFPTMLEAIRAARETINFQVYIFEPKGIGVDFLEAFKERARAGVEVRLMVDAFGSHKLDKRHVRELEEAGCQVKRFRPIKLLTLVRVFKRDHRRAIVVDGRVGFTGGGAIAEKWTGKAQDPHHWRDSMLRVEGPLAAAIQTAFGENWVYCAGEIVAGVPFYSGEPEDRAAEPVGLAVVSSPSDSAQPIRLLFWLSFVAARERIWISSSYFVPGASIRNAIKQRARAGVDVRILVPGKNTDAHPVRLAGRGLYQELLEAGVRIFEYEPTMMHAKTVVVDSRWSVLGSANMDERSTEINEENSIGVLDRDLAGEIERGLEQDMAVSREIDLAAWRRRSLIARIGERAASLLMQQY